MSGGGGWVGGRGGWLNRPDLSRSFADLSNFTHSAFSRRNGQQRLRLVALTVSTRNMNICKARKRRACTMTFSTNWRVSSWPWFFVLFLQLCGPYLQRNGIWLLAICGFRSAHFGKPYNRPLSWTQFHGDAEVIVKSTTVLLFQVLRPQALRFFGIGEVHCYAPQHCRDVPCVYRGVNGFPVSASRNSAPAAGRCKSGCDSCDRLQKSCWNL